MIDLFQARRESHEARELDHEFKIQEGGVSLEVPRVEGQAFYPSGDAPRMTRDGTPMENIKEGLADLPKAVGSAGAGLAAGAAGLPGDLVSLIGGLGSALFPGDQSRMEAFTSTMTDISETIGSERFLGLYRDIVNNSDFSLEDKQMMLDTAEGASFLSIPGAATVAKGSSDAIRSGVVKAGEAAQARLDEAAGSTTLASGVDVGKGIDQAIAAAGRQFADAQVRYFETGKFEPPTAENPVSVVLPTETEPGIIAFHGSGADFDEFRLEMIGTGEGSQAFGYGLYFTDSEDIARFYKEAMLEERNQIQFKGKPLDSVYTVDIYEKFGDDISQIIQKAKEMGVAGGDEEIIEDAVIGVFAQLSQGLSNMRDAQTAVDSLRSGRSTGFSPEKTIYRFFIEPEVKVPEIPQGRMYKVALSPKPDELLDYDLDIARMPKEMRAKIEAAARRAIEMSRDPKINNVNNYDPGDNPTIGALLGDSGSRFTELSVAGLLSDFEDLVGKRLSTKLLHDEGIPGLKYRASGSRSPNVKDEDAKRNYVIFDDKAVKILEKYGIVGPVAITAAAAGQSNDNEDGGI